MDVLGIDVSKADFHACLLQGAQQRGQSFPNNPKGYRQLQRWLRNRAASEVHACMEATGGYWLKLATALFEHGVTVSVVNPARTALFARSQLRRTKTDSVDAEMIAQYCQTQRPGPWSPPPPEILELRGLLSYRGQLVDERARLKQIASEVYVGPKLQRLHDAHLRSAQKAIAGVETQLAAEVQAHPELAAQVAKLDAISGIGFLTAVTIVAKLPVQRLRDGKAAAAYVGLVPSERRSGTSVHGKPRLCKTGDADLRKALFMPATVARQHNPILAAFAQRLEARGKPNKTITVAVMRKLIVLAFSLLKEPTSQKMALTA